MLDPKNELLNQISQEVFSTNEFNEELRTHVKFVRESMERKREEFLPQLILVTGLEKEKRGLHVIGLVGMPETTDEKRALFGQIGLAAAEDELDVVMALFESEAWTAECKGEWDGVQPSKRKDRKEIIVVMARSLDARVGFARIDIVRDADNNIVLGDDVVVPFNEKDEQHIEDALLSAFFEAFAVGRIAKILKKRMDAAGIETPPEMSAVLELMGQNIVKLKRVDHGTTRG
jgi:hypothetical protein